MYFTDLYGELAADRKTPQMSAEKMETTASVSNGAGLVYEENGETLR